MKNALFLGGTAPVLAAIEHFLHEDHVEPQDDRPLATVMFTDIVQSTEKLASVGDSSWRRDSSTNMARTVSEAVAAYPAGS